VKNLKWFVIITPPLVSEELMHAEFILAVWL